MKKSILHLAIILGIVFLVGSATVFLLVENYTPQFWISYAAGVLALLAVGFGFWQAMRDSDHPSAYLLIPIGWQHAGAVAVVVFLEHIAFQFGVKLYGVIHLIALAVYIVRVIICLFGHAYIANQDKEVRRQVTKARMDTERATQLLEQADNLPPACREQAKKALREVEEKLRYSDPIASEETAEPAHNVDLALDSLEEALDSLLCGQIEVSLLELKAKDAIRKINAYNRAKKMMK